MTIPTNGMTITQNTVLDAGVYVLPDGIRIDADGVTLDGGGALIVGAGGAGQGVRVQGRGNVTIKNLRVSGYQHGITARGCRGLEISACQVNGTAEVQANTIFLDIWLPAERAYGGGIILVDCADSRVTGNDLQHQLAGLLAYGCQHLEVRDNNASYCSGWGFHLYATTDSLYEDNYADYCCRWNPRHSNGVRGPERRNGHMGADAAGFLIVYNSSRNVFRGNLARLGGDGFFLAGLAPSHELAPCNDNRFEANDGSYSPNIAFEATFSSGNVWVNNIANFCNYGYWLGFSANGVVEGSQVIGCRQAGIATEMGHHFTVRGCDFRDNGHGILLWSKHIPAAAELFPSNDNSYEWLIEHNSFLHNNTAVRIAANQDHGIRPYAVPAGEDPTQFCRPHDHTLRRNTFRDNRVAVEARCTDRTMLEDNVFAGNGVDDLREG